MKCHVCDQDKGEGFLTPLGFACKDCEAASSAEWKAVCDTERALPIDDGPDQYDLPEFERFSLRLALHFLDDKAFVNKLRNANPMMCCPSEFSLWIKDQLIHAAPEHFTTWEARSHERIFSGGSFRIIGTIPKAKAIRAAEKAGLLCA